MTTTLDNDLDAATDAHQYLTFNLGDEAYGLDILAVQEIKGLNAITRMPNTPQHLRGVTNLRGAVVPIVDLRSRFAMPDRPYDKWTVFVIVTIGNKIVGLVVDAVDDVVDIEPASIQPTPELATSKGESYVRGIAHVGERLIALLDIDRIIGAELTGAPVS
ncbi:MAG: chemotaxis protein CheW [Gemmatimonadaceae bacterium]